MLRHICPLSGELTHLPRPPWALPVISPIELSRFARSQGSVACCLIRLVATERAVAPSAAETLMNRFSYCQPRT